jgi:hypothetical protein
VSVILDLSEEQPGPGSADPGHETARERAPQRVDQGHPERPAIDRGEVVGCVGSPFRTALPERLSAAAAPCCTAPRRGCTAVMLSSPVRLLEIPITEALAVPTRTVYAKSQRTSGALVPWCPRPPSLTSSQRLDLVDLTGEGHASTAGLLRRAKSQRTKTPRTTQPIRIAEATPMWWWIRSDTFIHWPPSNTPSVTNRSDHTSAPE